jgi:hypothetical protein
VSKIKDSKRTDPEDGGGEFHRNACNHSQDYTVS